MKKDFLLINFKNQDITLDDILKIDNEYSIQNPKKIINEINQSFLNWNKIAQDLNISKKVARLYSGKVKNHSLKT